MPGPENAPKFYLQWNLPNWITVTLMAGIGVVVIGAAASALRAYKGLSGDDGN